jgi:hypothetical protein
VAAGQDVGVEIEEARLLLAPLKAQGADGEALKALRAALGGRRMPLDRLMAPETLALMARIGPRANLTLYARDLPLWIDRERAAFGAWYELFPRSMGPGHDHGTFDDVIGHLPYVAILASTRSTSRRSIRSARRTARAEQRAPGRTGRCGQPLCHRLERRRLPRRPPRSRHA